MLYVEQSYLPSQTPSGLRSLREKELGILRGDGTGERKAFERIYDYDTYNDLGDPDKSEDLARPVLGGSKEFPYPRRCRTGHPLSETRITGPIGSTYVPRDEAFSKVRKSMFDYKTVQSLLQSLVPRYEESRDKFDFPSFTAIDSLYNDGMKLPKQEWLSSFFSPAYLAWSVPLLRPPKTSYSLRPQK